MFPVGIYQGSITLLAGLVKPYLTDLMIGRLSCIGSILIFALGLNLTIGTKIKIAKYASGCIPAGYRMPVGILKQVMVVIVNMIMKGHYHVKRRKTDLDLK